MSLIDDFRGTIAMLEAEIVRLREERDEARQCGDAEAEALDDATRMFMAERDRVTALEKAIQTVLDRHKGEIRTHSPSCHEYHDRCYLLMVLRGAGDAPAAPVAPLEPSEVPEVGEEDKSSGEPCGECGQMPEECRCGAKEWNAEGREER